MGAETATEFRKSTDRRFHALVCAVIGLGMVGCQLPGDPPTYRPDFNSGYLLESAWGGIGNEINEFKDPYGSDVDNHNELLYIADCKNNRIQVFTLSGAYVRSFGTEGYGDGQFRGPSDVKVSPSSGQIYVVEEYNHRVQVLEPDGTHVMSIGSFGTAPGQFSFPLGIALDRNGNLYVVDYRNDRIQKFNPEGVFIKMWGTTGTGDGEFRGPYYIESDAEDNLFVLDRGNHRVQKFTREGIFLAKWGRNGGDGSRGSGDGEFNWPHEIAVDQSGNVYVADMYNNRFQVFTGGGVFLGSWGGSALFGLPKAIAVDREYRVYVIDISPPKNLRVVTRWRPRKMVPCMSGDKRGCIPR